MENKTWVIKWLVFTGAVALLSTYGYCAVACLLDFDASNIFCFLVPAGAVVMTAIIVPDTVRFLFGDLFRKEKKED